MTKISDEIKEQHAKNKQKLKAMGPVKIIILAIMVVGTICSFVFYDFFYGKYNAWCTTADYGNVLLNNVTRLVPRLVTCVQVITIVLVVVTVVLFVIRKLFTKTPRATTVAGLISNLIRWLTGIVLVIVVLAIWGVDTTALITGAGVVTLVVGLGMQSLIADIVAGLFIVFENEFNIGDFITVDGFRGEVISIGVRTTKLKAAGNIKIFNNNAIQGVLNHTLEPSIAKTLIDIDYGAKLPEVEKVIRENIEKLDIPGAVDKAKYDGVASLGESGVTLQFTCHCYEGDIFAVGRALNGAVKNMFDENGINIPFPQVVVHKGE